MKITRFLIPLFFLSSLCVKAQDLKGEWKLLKSPNSIGQESTIIKIESRNIYFYEFDNLIARYKAQFLNKHSIQIADTILLKCQFINGENDFMKIISVNGRFTDYLKYVRIQPTSKIKENQLSKFKTSTFEFIYKKDTVNFNLGEKYQQGNLLMSYYANFLSDSVGIVKRNDTYFLNFYLKGKIRNIFPIKEMKKSGLIIYGLPSGIEEFHVELKK